MAISMPVTARACTQRRRRFSIASVTPSAVAARPSTRSSSRLPWVIAPSMTGFVGENPGPPRGGGGPVTLARWLAGPAPRTRPRAGEWDRGAHGLCGQSMTEWARGLALAAFHDGVTVVCELAALFPDDGWAAPTPCPEWRAGDLAGHLRCV